MEEENELSEELLGLHGFNFAVDNNSSARNVMFASHFSQRLVISGATEKIIQTGVESEFSKYTFNIKMPENGRIIAIIDRYPQGIDIDNIPFNPESVVIYEDDRTKEIGHFVLKNHASFHTYFGFPYKYSREVNKIVPGAFIEKGTVFADSPAVSENGGYKYGVTLNTALMSHPAVAEDGVLISRDALKKLEFKLYDTRVVEFGMHEYPLNLYGNKNLYKPFPEIGETIREDGLLMMLRSYDNNLAPVEMSSMDTMEPDYTFDNGIYVRGPGGKIVDIKVFKDDAPQSPMAPQFMQPMSKYAKALKTFYKKLIETERQIRSERKKKFNTLDVIFKPGLHRLLVEAYCVTNEPLKPHNQKLNLLYRKSKLDEYRIEFTIEYTMRPSTGYKLTGVSGDKGVIVSIVDPEVMPVDSDGNRAEIIMDAGSTISRMNLARLYEQYISAASRDVSKKLRRDLGVEGLSKHAAEKKIEKLNKEEVNKAYNYLLGFYNIISSKQWYFYNNLPYTERVHHLAECSDITYIFSPISNEKEKIDIVKDLEKYYRPTYGPVSYIGLDGKKVTTIENVRIGPMYFMLLEKIADEWSSVSTGRLHHFGVLSVATKSEKYRHPFRNSPVRTIGETEGRIFVGYCGEEAIAEMMDRSNNPRVMKSMVENILRASNPGNIDKVVDRTLYPLGGTRPLQLFNHMSMVSGWKAIYVPEEVCRNNENPS